MTAPYTRINVTYSDGCLANAEWASWDVYHPTEGLFDILFYDGDGVATDKMDFYDWERLGRYDVEPTGAYDFNFDPMTQNTRSFTVKLGSRSSISTSRSGNYVTIRSTNTRYYPSRDGYGAWSGVKVAIHYKTCSTCEWRYLKSATANTYGKTSTTVYSSKARYYRTVLPTIFSTWGAKSVTAYR